MTSSRMMSNVFQNLLNSAGPAPAQTEQPTFFQEVADAVERRIDARFDKCEEKMQAMLKEFRTAMVQEMKEMQAAGAVAPADDHSPPNGKADNKASQEEASRSTIGEELARIQAHTECTHLLGIDVRTPH